MKADAFVLLCASCQGLRPPLQLGNKNPSIKHKTRFSRRSSLNRALIDVRDFSCIQTAFKWSSRFWETRTQPTARLSQQSPPRSLAGRERNALCVVHRLTYCGLIHCQVLSEYLIWALYEITYRYQLQKCILKKIKKRKKITRMQSP